MLAGIRDILIEAWEFVRALQKRQGIRIACLEEIAFSHGFITRDQLLARGRQLSKTDYGLFRIDIAERAAQKARAGE